MPLNSNFYTQTIGGQKADFYRICIAYGITDPCIAHALKKLLRAGRSHKSLAQDIQDAIDTLKRWQQIQEEDKGEEIIEVSTIGFSEAIMGRAPEDGRKSASEVVNKT